MLATSDTGALLRFVQRPNSVDLAAGEESLQARGRYSELVALLQAKGRHSAALDILKKVSQKTGDLPTPPQGMMTHQTQIQHQGGVTNSSVL